jgi:pimeloyl-ACP methyl ester carboxylesterase
VLVAHDEQQIGFAVDRALCNVTSNSFMEVIAMPTFERGGVSLYYEEYGSGYPILLFAPGGMKSTIGVWHINPMGQPNPIDPIKEYPSDFRVIAMDQRNAGRSRAPITASDGWDTYTADQLALLDHLGIRRCHIMGMCIGGSYCFNMINKAPERVSAAVLLQPIGTSSENVGLFDEMFDNWAKELKAERPDLNDTALASFRKNMYGSDFVFSVTRDFVRNCRTPLLVLAGNDRPHPAGTSKEIGELAPNVELITTWKTPEAAPQASARIREFLKKHQG